MVDWRKRLFHQRHDVSAPVVRGRDVGFTGRAGRVVIDDDYRLADFQAAETARQRFYASHGWLTKLARNGERAFEELGERALLEAVDRALDAVASAQLRAAGDLKAALSSMLEIDETNPQLPPDFGSWFSDLALAEPPDTSHLNSASKSANN
jgi:hypothetical protein